MQSDNLKKIIKVAIIGNPNSGKTTIFNALTGQNQKVANYPGVTVEIKEGIIETTDVTIKIVDCPGTYSLLPYSLEERIARRQLLQNSVDVVIDVIDSSTLERGLFLALQIKELGLPLIIALNMTDIAKARGIEIDYKKLSSLLNTPILPTVGNKGIGLDGIIDATIQTANKKSVPFQINYPQELTEPVKILSEKIAPYLTDKEQCLK